jgi:hypothetical protein
VLDYLLKRGQRHCTGNGTATLYSCHRHKLNPFVPHIRTLTLLKPIPGPGGGFGALLATGIITQLPRLPHTHPLKTMPGDDHCNPRDPCDFYGEDDIPDNYVPDESICGTCPVYPGTETGVNAGDPFSSGSTYPSGGHAGNSAPQGNPGTPIVNYDPVHRIKLGDQIPPTYRFMEPYYDSYEPFNWKVGGGFYLDLCTGIDILDRCNKNTSGKEYFCFQGGKLMKYVFEANSEADGGSRWIFKRA